MTLAPDLILNLALLLKSVEEGLEKGYLKVEPLPESYPVTSNEVRQALTFQCKQIMSALADSIEEAAFAESPPIPDNVVVFPTNVTPEA